MTSYIYDHNNNVKALTTIIGHKEWLEDNDKGLTIKSYCQNDITIVTEFHGRCANEIMTGMNPEFRDRNKDNKLPLLLWRTTIYHNLSRIHLYPHSETIQQAREIHDKFVNSVPSSLGINWSAALFRIPSSTK